MHVLILLGKRLLHMLKIHIFLFFHIKAGNYLIYIHTSKLPVQFWKEKPVFGGNYDFFDKTGGRFFEPIFLTNYYYLPWKFAIRILKISQLVLKLSVKNRFLMAILNFFDKTGSRFFKPLYFTNHYHRSWKFAIEIFKIAQLVLNLSAKNRFRRQFCIFTTKPEVEFSNLYILQITTIDPENLPLKFWQYLN